jgi:predicted HTH transcriptional regulator
VVPVKGVAKVIDKGVSKKNVKVSKGGLNSRQEQIFNYIKLNSEVKMSSVSQIFNKVTPRTLRRDFEKLQQLGLVRQEGKTRDAVYKII